MKSKFLFSIGLLSLCAVASARAQADGASGGTSPNKPMALNSGETSKTETSKAETTQSDSKGFWMFPEAAPLTGSIVTDRPGFSDSAALIPRGHFQIESGYTFSYDREDHRRVYNNNMPEIALRTGLTDWLEFRAQWAGYSYSEVLDRIKTPAGRTVSDTNHVDGGRDLNVGFKLPVIKGYCDKFNLSAIPSLYLPTGSDSTSNNEVVPELKFPWNYAITKEFTAYGSVLGRVPNSDDGQFFQTAVTIAGGYTICDRVTLYLEYLGVYPTTPSQDCTHLLSGGPIFKITDNISLDTRVAVGLNEQAPDFQASIGFGIRF